MSSRLLTRTRPRLTNTPSLSESSDTVAASVVHTISLSSQPASPEIDMHEAHGHPTATLSDLISRRMQADLVENLTRNNVPQALQTLSSMSPIVPKQSSEKGNFGILDTQVDISIARTAGNLPPWHQHYRAGPSELLAVPYDKMRQPSDKIPEEIAPSVHLNHKTVTDQEKKRPISAKYLSAVEKGNTENNKIPYKATEPNESTNKVFMHIPNQTPPPYAFPHAFSKVALPESPSPLSNDSLDQHEVISHLDKDTKTVPPLTDNAQIMNITKTVLANRVPAPTVMQPSYFDHPTSNQSAISSGIIPVKSKPEPEPELVLPPTNFVSIRGQCAPQFNKSNTPPENIVEVVSLKNPRETKPEQVQESEPLSVLIQKAILRQHKDQLGKAPNSMVEIAARAQQMKGAYDIENRPFQPINVLTPSLGQTDEKQPSVTFSDSSKDIDPRITPVVAATQISTEKNNKVKSKKNPSRRRYCRRSSSTESSSSSYYYSSYSEDSEERVKWLSLGKDLANYPLYVTKYTHCGKCQYKQGYVLENSLTEHKSDSLKCLDKKSPSSQSPSIASMELQLNYLHRSPLDKISSKSTALLADHVSSPQLIVHQASLPNINDEKCVEEAVHAHQITRLKHTVTQKKFSDKDISSCAKEIIVTTVRRGMETSPTSSSPIFDSVAHTSNQNAPTLDLNYNINGFTTQDPDSVDYNEVLFVLSREKGDAQQCDTQMPTPPSTKKRLPPRAVKDSSPSMLAPVCSSTSIRQEAPRISKVVTSLQIQSSEKKPTDSHEVIQAVLAHPFCPSRAPVVNNTAPKPPSDLSYLSYINNIMDMHSVSAVSDTPERFQHYHNDSSIMAGPLQQSSSYLSPEPQLYARNGFTTPDMNDETFSNLEEGEIPQNYQYIHGGHLPFGYTHISQNTGTNTGSIVENEQEIPSLVELANCSLTPEEDLVLAKAMEALNI